MIVLGSYNLDVEEMTLSRDGIDVVLEPKILEVLLYLYEKKDTYISMEELHNNVWQGRVVSDAAVRRTISKLRLLFNDDHKVPRYIKSMPKRGYKLICPVSESVESTKEETKAVHRQPDLSGIVHPPEQAQKVNQSHNTNDKHTTNSPDNSVSGLKDNNSSLTRDKPKKMNKLVWLLPLIIFCLFIISIAERIFEHEADIEAQYSVTSEIIKALPGDKVAIAQSPNGQYLAFSGQLSEQSGYQVYVKQQNGHDFAPATHKAFFPVSLAFSRGNERLFYSDMKEGNSSLNTISMTNAGSYKTEALLENYFMIGDVFTSPDTSVIYFSGQQKSSEPRFIYRYDLVTRQVVRVTSSTQRHYLDIRGDISPDGRHMAVFRYSKFDKSYEIRVIDIVTNEVINRRPQKSMVWDLQWLDNEYLLLLDQERLIKVDTKNNSEAELIKKAPHLASIVVIDKQQLLALSTGNSVPKKLFMEQQLPFDEWNTRQIFNVATEIYYMSYHAKNDAKLVVFDRDDISTLAKLNTNNNDITPYIQTEYDIFPIGSASSGILELLKLNNRFALFNSETNGLIYITSGDDFVGDASFSTDDQSILFSLKSYDQWEIYRFDIGTSITSKLFTGFRSIRPYGDDFILATDNGELFLYKSSTDRKVPLNFHLSIYGNTHWDISGHYIYWSDHDLVRTVFHQLDISDINNLVKTEHSFDYNKVRPYFSLKKDGTSLLYFLGQQDDTHLLTLNLQAP